MAQIRDIPASVLASDGREVNTGVLSILEKKGIRMLKSSEYQLNPLYWRLISYASQTYLLGYAKHLPGAKAIKKLLIKGCSIEMNPPDKVVVSQHSNETFLCIQSADKFTFLMAESKRQRNKWVDAIRNALTEPIYISSTVSTTSTDSSESVDVHRNRDHVERFPKSVHNTADTAPRPGPNFRRVKTSPAGLSEMENRLSVSSIPSSAHALNQQKKRSQQQPVDMTHQSATYSLNSQDRMRGSSQRVLNESGIHAISDQPNLPDYNEPTQSHCKKSASESKASQQNQSSNEQEYEQVEGNCYTALNWKDDDDQSFVSRVDNLGLLESKTREKHNLPYDVYDDTAPPEPPQRDYVPYVNCMVELGKKRENAPRQLSAPTKQPRSPDSGLFNGEHFQAYTNSISKDQPSRSLRSSSDALLLQPPRTKHKWGTMHSLL